ncbi:tetraspanin-5-like isoform X1 [Lineus longissimus]|uniref:tetraspanin-5-like isoform X1 n=1 Tax=Lineus longissimus TaxID=88925 RepID=UPI002B4D616A
MAKRRRRDRTEVSCCIKYLVFGFNVLFWFMGVGICAVGIWAWSEKDVFANISQLTTITVDPALILIITGGVMFIIGFAGCTGALRENTCLLLFYCVAIGVIFFAELILGILGFVYKDWVKEQMKGEMTNLLIHYRDDQDWQNLIDWVQLDWVKTQIKTQLKVTIDKYRDDSDLQNLIDWVQTEWLHCCGVDGAEDWDLNMYFNCTSKSAEKCGVPFSCCRPRPGEELINKQCGYYVRHPSQQSVSSLSEKIYTTGCLEAGEKWLEEHLIPVAGVAVGVALVQILGICFAQNLRSDIFAQRAKWH